MQKTSRTGNLPPSCWSSCVALRAAASGETDAYVGWAQVLGCCFVNMAPARNGEGLAHVGSLCCAHLGRSTWCGEPSWSRMLETGASSLTTWRPTRSPASTTTPPPPAGTCWASSYTHEGLGRFSKDVCMDCGTQEWASYTHAFGIEPLERVCNEWAPPSRTMSP